MSDVSGRLSVCLQLLVDFVALTAWNDIIPNDSAVFPEMNVSRGCFATNNSVLTTVLPKPMDHWNSPHTFNGLDPYGRILTFLPFYTDGCSYILGYDIDVCCIY